VIVRKALYPVVGKRTLEDIIAEAKAKEKEFNTRVRTKLRGSYSHHYRRGLPKLLKAVTFRSSNEAFQPVMDALALLGRYADSEADFYDAADAVPLEHVVPDDWRDAVVDEDTGLVERIPYELCVLVALRKAVRRREIWVEGGSTWRNPDHDLPGDFEDNRDVHYRALSKPRDPADFVADLQKRHVAALEGLNTGLRKGSTGGVRITRKKGEPWISVPPVLKQAEPENLGALKEEIARRWGVIDLLDLIKNVDHATEFIGEFASVASRTVTDAAVLRRRLLLCTFGLGTNMGIKRVADGTAAIPGMEADTEAALRRTRRLFVNRDNLRAAIRTVVNKTLEARDTSLWGPGTACASDSRKFGSWSANFMTEWHQRYGGAGIMVYWHVERKNVCIYSQVRVHDRLRGRLDDRGPAPPSDLRRDRPPVHRHPRCLDRRVRVLAPAGLQAAATAEERRVGSPVPAGPGRGRGVAGAGRRAVGQDDRLGADRQPVRPDDQVCDRVAAQDRRGPPDAAPVHPRWAQAPHLPCDRGTRPGHPYRVHLRLSRRRGPAPGDPRGPQRGGELERGEQGHLLRQGRRPHRRRPRARRGVRPGPAPVQASIVYLNTRMVQIVLAEPAWQKKLTDADRRGLSALFWTHLNLYGKFELDMSKQLDLGPDTPVT
jgi:hypothetical protein